MTGLAILGSTGSIGRQTLEVVRHLRGRFRIIGLAAGRNVTLLEEQAREFSPTLLWVDREGDYLHQKAAGLRARWAPMEEMASHPDVGIVVVATPGRAGLLPPPASMAPNCAPGTASTAPSGSASGARTGPASRASSLPARAAPSATSPWT